MHAEAEVAPGPVVVPLPQLIHNDPSWYEPTLQMHSEADEAPGPAVVKPLSQLSHTDDNSESVSRNVPAGHNSQLGVVSPSTRAHPLPAAHAFAQGMTHATNP